MKQGCWGAHEVKWAAHWGSSLLSVGAQLSCGLLEDLRESHNGVQRLTVSGGGQEEEDKRDCSPHMAADGIQGFHK